MSRSLVTRILGRLFRLGRPRAKKEPRPRRITRFLGWLASFALVASVGCLAAHQYEFSVGERSGQLIKFSHEGVFFKTWEGELKLTESGAQTWAFTVPDAQLAGKLQQRMGQAITLHYSKRLVSQSWVGDTSYLVDGVR